MNLEIELEQLNINHSNELYDLTEANRKYLSEWLPWLDQIKTSGDTRTFVESTIKVGSYHGIMPSVQGWAQVTGYNTILVDPRDPYAHGFEVN